MPLSGEIIEVNTVLSTEADPVNSEPFEGGWMIKIVLLDASELEQLLDAEAYNELIR